MQLSRESVWGPNVESRGTGAGGRGGEGVTKALGGGHKGTNLMQMTGFLQKKQQPIRTKKETKVKNTVSRKNPLRTRENSDRRVAGATDDTRAGQMGSAQTGSTHETNWFRDGYRGTR